MERKTIISDIDGTIANLDHRLSLRKEHIRLFFDACDKDTPIKNVISLLNILKKDHDIVFITGRAEFTRSKTVKWIVENTDIELFSLHMRKNNDKREDHIIKSEIIDNLGLKPSNVVTVFEDRQSVVDMWREKGFHVCQVDKGDF